jgi:CheY-like chemotaxis protein
VQVAAATIGQEAIEIAASHTGDIDVLLTDVVMPQMLGKEAAERIRALRPGVTVLFQPHRETVQRSRAARCA